MLSYFASFLFEMQRSKIRRRCSKNLVREQRFIFYVTEPIKEHMIRKAEPSLTKLCSLSQLSWYSFTERLHMNTKRRNEMHFQVVLQSGSEVLPQKRMTHLDRPINQWPGGLSWGYYIPLAPPQGRGYLRRRTHSSHKRLPNSPRQQGSHVCCEGRGKNTALHGLHS